MSHYTRGTTQFTDAALLKEAIEAEFGKQDLVEIFDEPQPMFGFKGDERKEKAEIVIRRKKIGRGSNDVGFAWNEQSKTYDAVISQFDKIANKKGGQLNFDDATLGRIKQRYAVLTVQQQMLPRGFRIVQDTQEGTTKRLVLQRVV